MLVARSTWVNAGGEEQWGAQERSPLQTGEPELPAKVSTWRCRGDVIGEQGVLKAGVSADDERRRPPAPGVDLQTWTSGRRGGAGRQLGDSARPDTNPSLPPRLPELLPGPGRDDGGGPVIPLPGGPAASRGTCTPARAFLIV